jgi:hypothetical protein
MPAGRRPPRPGPRPGPPPGYRRGPAPRPQQLRPRSHRRHHHRSRGRGIVIGVLVVATLLFAGWWFMGRGSSTPGKDFTSVEHRFVAAARAIPATTGLVQRFLDLDDFNAQVDAQALVMQTSMAEFTTIAEEEDGEASDLARGAVKNGERALRAITRFRAAITTSNDLVDAQSALDDLSEEVDDLEGKLEQWNNL